MPVLIVLSRENPDPLYRQITDQVRDAIAAGDLAPGAKLPSIRDMARELDISVITVKRAYMDLETEGYIVTRPGLGSFVASVDRDRVRAEKLAELRRELSRLVAAAGKFGIGRAEIARLLNEVEES